MLGEAESLNRANTVALLRRKGGINPIPVVTRADAEYVLNWHHRLHELPEAHQAPIQNDDGSWPYVAGWDGPG